MKRPPAWDIVALSVGTDRLSENGYFRAKIAQEKLIKSLKSPTPWCMRRNSSSSHGLADISMVGTGAFASCAFSADGCRRCRERRRKDRSPPVNGIVEVRAEQFRVDELVRPVARSKIREVTLTLMLYSGAKLSEKTLIQAIARLGEARFEMADQPAAQIPSAHPSPQASQWK
jgi:hypothetical protein